MCFLLFSVDHSRVKLLPGDDEDTGDYINANYMPVSCSLIIIKHDSPNCVAINRLPWSLQPLVGCVVV